jgi:hypothetical protein
MVAMSLASNDLGATAKVDTTLELGATAEPVATAKLGATPEFDSRPIIFGGYSRDNKKEFQQVSSMIRRC